MITVRELTNKDLSTVIGIFRRASKEVQLEIVNQGELSIASILTALMGAEDEMWAWMADLAGVSVEEFMPMPITTSMDVIDQLADSEVSRDFFARAAARVGPSLRKLMMQFRIATAGQTKKWTDSPSPEPEESSDS